MYMYFERILILVLCIIGRKWILFERIKRCLEFVKISKRHFKRQNITRMTALAQGLTYIKIYLETDKRIRNRNNTITAYKSTKQAAPLSSTRSVDDSHTSTQIRAYVRVEQSFFKY